jgi:UDP-N-acetylglucosamine/UDP-N-acetylgalactosamine diphosphorylase
MNGVINNMDIDSRFRKAQKALEEHGQGHLLAFWGELDEAKKVALLEQIEGLDLREVDKWVADYVKKASPLEVPTKINPAPAYPVSPAAAQMQKKYEKAREKGRQLISGGKVAALVVAGGQGTRLGYDGPKGNFPISPIKGKTLFRLFAEQIAAASKKYRVSLPWYIMTSPLNRQTTEEIFERNEWFGLDKKDIYIFQQGTMPNFGFDGKILMDDKATLSQSPNGHGGTMKAIADSGALADMHQRGVEIISYFQVDNPLINIFDPLFIGLHVVDGAEMSSKALTKTGPKEKIGAFCLVDGKVTVIEYSDLSDEQAERKNPDGSLVFGLGSIAIHVINVKFVEKLRGGELSLPFHKAIKKVPYIDAAGKRIEPREPNGVKLEMFIFDALPLAKKSVVLETPRSEEFAPVKNASGVDSEDVTRTMMTSRAAAWLEAAGMKAPRKADGSVDAIIEMSPGFAIDVAEVKAKIHKIKKIKAGDRMYLD